MCFLEKRLHKIVPPMFDLFVTPLVSVFVTGYLTLAAIGPLFTTVENFVIDGVQWLIAIPFGIGSFIMGGLYATTVVSGIHHMYTICLLYTSEYFQSYGDGPAVGQSVLCVHGVCGVFHGLGCF